MISDSLPITASISSFLIYSSPNDRLGYIYPNNDTFLFLLFGI